VVADADVLVLVVVELEDELDPPPHAATHDSATTVATAAVSRFTLRGYVIFL